MLPRPVITASQAFQEIFCNANERKNKTNLFSFRAKVIFILLVLLSDQLLRMRLCYCFVHTVYHKDVDVDNFLAVCIPIAFSFAFFRAVFNKIC
jgi:hypothetical protein